MLEKVQELQLQVNAFTTNSIEELEAFRISFLGKKGKVTLLFNEFRNVPNDQKKEFGAQLNSLKKIGSE
jgi:phenylalanyl-tRNA synthetase alpha chain